METLIGIKGKDFVLMAADSYAPMSVCRLKNDEDKLLIVDNDKVFGCSGMIGDRTHFGEYIRKNVHLYRFRCSYPLDTKATAHFVRSELAYFLRRNPYRCDFMLAGCDEEGPLLYWIDYLASMVSVEKAAHGYGAYLVMSILDRYYHHSLEETEAIDIIRKCTSELRNRFIISQSDFIVKIIDKKDGIRTLYIN